jgi:hypothetical protein
MFLKQSTAATIILGPFVDSTDGVTAETSLTISQADVRLSKNGAAFAQKNESSAASHMENGNYSCALNTTDTGTLGRLRVAVNESGALPVWADFMVLPANVFDSLFGSDRLQVHVAEMTDGIITAAALAADAVDEIFDEVVEGSLTMRQAWRLVLSMLTGESTGGGTSSIAFRDLADTKNRLVFTVDVDRNRTAVTRDGS